MPYPKVLKSGINFNLTNYPFKTGFDNIVSLQKIPTTLFYFNN